MNYLKKVMSIFLVYILCAGMLPSVAADGYTDMNDVQNIAEVQLMESLQIMRGHADGSFDPKGYLTRAQAAKVIYVARTGSDRNADQLAKLPGYEFADVPNSFWAAGYIKFSASQGFVTGRGNSTFDPNGYITGYEYLKILLGALGYSAEIERFSYHLNWKMFVAVAAVDAGLTEGFTGNLNNPISRDEAALLTANMLKSNIVSYNAREELMISDTIYGKKYFDLKVNTGVVIANGSTNTALRGRTTLRVPDGGIGTSGTYETDTGLRELGRSVTIYTKGSSFTAIYGAANVDATNKTATTFAALAAGDATAPASLLKWLSDSGFKPGNTAPISITKGIDEVTFEDITTNAAGEQLTVIDNNGDKIIDYMLKLVKTAAEVTGKSTDGTGSIVFDRIPGTWNASNVENFNALEVGDIVLAYEEGGYLRTQKAVFVEGQMTSYTPHLQQAGINGVNYGASGIAYTDINGADENAFTFAQWIAQYENFHKDMLFYLDDGGNVIRIKSAETEPVARQYAYILDSMRSYETDFLTPQTARVQLLYSDGTTSIAKVNKLDALSVQSMTHADLDRKFHTPGAHADLVVGKIFSYTIKADGSVDLMTADTQHTAPSAIRTNDPNLVAHSVYADNKTLFVAHDRAAGTSKTYVGVQNVPVYTSVSGVILFENSIAKIVFITDATEAPSQSRLVYILGAPSISMGDTGLLVYTYPIFADGIVSALTVDAANSDLAAGLYTYTKAANGTFNFTAAGDVTGSIDIAGDGIIVVNSTAYIIDAETQVYHVTNDGTVKAIEAKDLKKGAEVILVLSAEPSAFHAVTVFSKA